MSFITPLLPFSPHWVVTIIAFCLIASAVYFYTVLEKETDRQRWKNALESKKGTELYQKALALILVWIDIKLRPENDEDHKSPPAQNARLWKKLDFLTDFQEVSRARAEQVGRAS